MSWRRTYNEWLSGWHRHLLGKRREVSSVCCFYKEIGQRRRGYSRRTRNGPEAKYKIKQPKFTWWEQFGEAGKWNVNHEEHTSTVLGKYTPWRALNAESRGPDTTQQLKGKQLPFTHVAKAPSQIRKLNYNKSELSPFSFTKFKKHYWKWCGKGVCTCLWELAWPAPLGVLQSTSTCILWLNNYTGICPNNTLTE